MNFIWKLKGDKNPQLLSIINIWTSVVLNALREEKLHLNPLVLSTLERFPLNCLQAGMVADCIFFEKCFLYSYLHLGVWKWITSAFVTSLHKQPFPRGSTHLFRHQPQYKSFLMEMHFFMFVFNYGSDPTWQFYCFYITCSLSQSLSL